MDKRNKRILIVDDQVESLQTIYHALEQAAISDEIVLAKSVQQAHKVIKKRLPDLIITDWEMPESDGIEFIMQLKEDAQTKDIPAIMCTGAMTSSKNLEMPLDAGAADYIRKPLDPLELTARVRANLHLSQKYKEVKQLNESKETLFSIISHDLRGALGRIEALTDIVKMSGTGITLEEMQHFMEIIGKQSSLISSIFENLLLWSQSQRDEPFADIRDQVINSAIEENIELLGEMAKDKEIELINRIPKPLVVKCDLNMVSAVFRNLIANAIKFTSKKGKVTLEAQHTSSNFVTFSVKDTGVGISPERIGKIFDKTSFETTKGTEKETGSGLELKLSQEFIHRQGGKIWVESELGAGSTFKFFLPLP